MLSRCDAAHHLSGRVWETGRTDVLLAGSFEGDLCGDNTHKDANLVGGLVDLVTLPVDVLHGGARHHV